VTVDYRHTASAALSVQGAEITSQSYGVAIGGELCSWPPLAAVLEVYSFTRAIDARNAILGGLGPSRGARIVTAAWLHETSGVTCITRCMDLAVRYRHHGLRLR